MIRTMVLTYWLPQVMKRLDWDVPQSLVALTYQKPTPEIRESSRGSQKSFNSKLIDMLFLVHHFFVSSFFFSFLSSVKAFFLSFLLGYNLHIERHRFLIFTYMCNQVTIKDVLKFPNLIMNFSFSF